MARIRIRFGKTRIKRLVEKLASLFENFVKAAVKRTKHYTDDKTSEKIFKKIARIHGTSVTLKLSNLHFKTMITPLEFRDWIVKKYTYASESFKNKELIRLAKWLKDKSTVIPPNDYKRISEYVVKKYPFKGRTTRKTINPKRDYARELGKEISSFAKKHVQKSGYGKGKVTYIFKNEAILGVPYRVKIRIR